MLLDLEEKVSTLREFVDRERETLRDRAPRAWINPELPKYSQCGKENNIKPILKDIKKKAIKWLFLLLSQLLSSCTIDQLKYFCKHTNNRPTGAKDQLVPN
uniref:DUF7086 domain-containing protein n=1 Tax=Cajanus cajan TaxID=3821 RepID=A0A151UGW0_CAJCA